MLDRTIFSKDDKIRLISRITLPPLMILLGVMIPWAVEGPPWARGDCTGTESDHGSAVCDSICRKEKTCNRP